MPSGHHPGPSSSSVTITLHSITIEFLKMPELKVSQDSIRFLSVGVSTEGSGNCAFPQHQKIIDLENVGDLATNVAVSLEDTSKVFFINTSTRFNMASGQKEKIHVTFKPNDPKEFKGKMNFSYLSSKKIETSLTRNSYCIEMATATEKEINFDNEQVK